MQVCECHLLLLLPENRVKATRVGDQAPSLDSKDRPTFWEE